MSETNPFYVRAVWDQEASVYFSETNISGLNAGSETLQEFFEITENLAPFMLVANARINAQQPLTVRPTSMAGC